MDRMRGELRVVDDKAQIWVCLDDVLDWLGTLPETTDHPAAAGAALEIRQMLIDFVSDAELQQKQDT